MPSRRRPKWGLTAADILCLRFVACQHDILVGFVSLIGGDLIDGLVIQAMGSANLTHVDDTPETADKWFFIDDPPVPLESRRPVTIAALAKSLRMDKETLRRRFKRAVDIGMVEQSPSGLFGSLNPKVLQAYDDGIVRGNGCLADFWAGLIAEGNPLALDNPGIAELLTQSPIPHRAIGRASTSFATNIATEVARLCDGDYLDAWLMMVLTAEAAAGHKQVPGEKVRFSPISALHLARASRSPAETVRRRINRLVGAGLVSRSEYGLTPIWPSGEGTPRLGMPALVNRLRRIAEIRAARLSEEPAKA